MKKSTRILALLLIIVSMLSMALGCEQVKTKLNAPENVRVTGGYVKWNMVDSASGYLVYIDDDEYPVSSTKFELSEADGLVVGQSYEIRVKAKGDGYLYAMSDYSESISYTHGKTPPAPVEDSSIADRLFELGLGLGTNALKDSNVLSRSSSSIFKKDAFTKDDLSYSSIGRTEAYKEEGKSFVETISKINDSYASSLDVGVSGGLFTAGFKAKYGISTSNTELQTKNQYYYHLEHRYIDSYYEINQRTIKENFEDKFDQYFLGYLDKLRNGDITPEKFFEIYGSHIRMAVNYGASIESNYRQNSDKALNTKTVKETLNTALNVDSPLVGVNASLDMELSNSFESTHESSSENLSIKSIGGEVGIDVMSFAQLGANYGAWVDGLDNEDKYEIISVAENGLIPVWDFLPDEYNDVAKLLKDYFVKQAKGIASELSEEERLITDKDKVYDYVPLTDFDFDKLKELGFNALKITIEFDAMREDEGYQWLQCKTGTGGEYNTILFARHFEVPHENSWTHYDPYTVIAFDKLENYEMLQIEWGANGNSGDDWKLKNVNVYLEVVEDEVGLVTSYTWNSIEQGRTEDRLITDEDGVYDLIPINMFDFKDLETNEFNGFKITIKFNAKEVDDGRQCLWVWTGPKGMYSKKIYSKSDDIQNSLEWYEYEWSFTVEFEDLQNLEYLQLEWGADGRDSKNDWLLGEVTIEIEAVIADLKDWL